MSADVPAVFAVSRPPIGLNESSRQSSTINTKRRFHYSYPDDDDDGDGQSNGWRNSVGSRRTQASLGARRGRTNGNTTTKLPDLKFHSIRGGDIRFEFHNNRAVNVSCIGVVFSNRPIAINERVSIRLADIAPGWSNIKFGVTNIHPDARHFEDLISYINRFISDDLDGYWMDSIPEECSSSENLLQFYIASNGFLRYSVNGNYKGIARTGANIEYPLWVLIYICGSGTVIEFVRPPGPSIPPQTMPSNLGATACIQNTTNTQETSSSINQMSTAALRRLLPEPEPLNWRNFPETGTVSRSQMTSSSSLQPTIPLTTRVNENTMTLPELKQAGLMSDSAPSVNDQPLPSMSLNQTALSSMLSVAAPVHNQNLTSNECVICMAAERNATFLCGHRSCLACANEMKKSTGLCPFCREPIKDIIKLF